jgi:hypothetical protein
VQLGGDLALLSALPGKVADTVTAEGEFVLRFHPSLPWEAAVIADAFGGCLRPAGEHGGSLLTGGCVEVVEDVGLVESHRPNVQAGSRGLVDEAGNGALAPGPGLA